MAKETSGIQDNSFELVEKDTHKVNIKEAKSNEFLLYTLLNGAFPGEWESDIPYLEGRNFRGDAVNKKCKVVIEINGGLHPFYITLKSGRRVLASKGGHSSVEGIERDYRKYNASIVDGWRPLIYTPEQLRNEPGLIISAVRQLCGYRDEAQTTLNLGGCKQATLKQAQVKIQ